MIFKTKHTKGNFVVIDSVFPQKEPYAFRNAEINEYIRLVKNFKVYTMHQTWPDKKAGFGHSYGISRKEFLENREGYLKHYPGNKNYIEYLTERDRYSFNLAYSFFLAETFTLLPFYERNNIPFVFVLYPGGLFGINSKESDYMLKKLFSSKHFRAVIVTQKITQDYLVSKKLCPANKIRYIYGGIVQFHKEDILPRRYFANDKSSLDICFVAQKYSSKGIDKGYDLFIDVAKKLSKKSEVFRFHVVGGFNQEDIDVEEIKDRITFYGLRKPNFLLNFYRDMDIFLSPNRPHQLFNGNFDGFPLGIDAGYCGAALFVADELKMNHTYKNGYEIEIIKLNTQKIVDLVMSYYNNPSALRTLAKRCQKRTQKLFDLDYQIEERLKVFNEFCSLEIGEAK